MTDEKIRYLEMIQNVVNSRATSSITITGWTVVIVAALFVLSAKDSNWIFACFAFFPVTAFWILDACFLKKERLYRALYEKIRTQGDELAVDFSLNVDGELPEPKSSLFRALFSETFLLFYGTMVGTIVAVVLITVLMKR